MAFVVRRPGGRWEIRESFVTDAGPRARTLASFKTLSSEVLDKAERRARRPLDREDLVRTAKRAGVPSERDPADAIAEKLVYVLSRGAAVRPALRRILVDRLASGPGSRGWGKRVPGIDAPSGRFETCPSVGPDRASATYRRPRSLPCLRAWEGPTRVEFVGAPRWR